MDYLFQADAQIARLIEREGQRQQETINLIASENYTSAAVREAQGSVLTNKYAEGYPGRRYYGGCEIVDEIERLAIERAKKLFGAPHANVQPHSGTQANMAAYFTLLKPGDTVLAMRLDQGGHLSHGSPVNFSGRLYNFVHYGVNKKTEMLDYEEIALLAEKYRPKLIVAGASSYSRIIDFARFQEIARMVDAHLLIDMAHIAGLVAAGLHPSPVPYADIVTATTHKTLRGPRSGFILCSQKWAKQVDVMLFPGSQGGPLMHVIAAKAICFQEAMTSEFVSYQQMVLQNARTLAEEFIKLGLRVVSGGTDTHMLLLDLTPLKMTGKEAETILGEAGIIVNRNAIPFDPLPPQQTSGLRLGTAAVTSRGFGPEQMKEIALLIYQLLARRNEKVKREVSIRVKELCAAFPLDQRL